jgi:fructokinase
VTGLRFGVDLGGTKTEIVALDHDGTVILRHRTATPRGTYRGIVDAIVALVRGAEAKLARAGTVGVGIPGAVSPATGLVKNANTTELIGHAFDRDLSDALGREVRLENDANCFALSEAADGAGAGQPVVFGVILGTGAGSGLVVDGKVLRGRHLIAGEWGHNSLPRPTPGEVARAPACYCGKAGCIEAWVSGPAFARDHLDMTGERLSTADILAAGTPQARASYARYVDRLGRALSHVVNLIDPDVIVLGGGMSNVARLTTDLPGAIRPHVFSDEFTTPVVRAMHGDSSGVRGAAWLWPVA